MKIRSGYHTGEIHPMTILDVVACCNVCGQGAVSVNPHRQTENFPPCLRAGCRGVTRTFVDIVVPEHWNNMNLENKLALSTIPTQKEPKE